MSNIEPESLTPDPIRDRLAKFFENNAGSAYKASESGSGGTIERPWGDSTVTLAVRLEGLENVATALDAVYLPPRFSAVYHRDLHDLEFIWTPLSPPPDIEERSFEFRYGGSVYKCEWAASSTALLAIADSYVPDAPIGVTGHRNLDTFTLYFHYQKEHPDLFEKMPKPVSFWIRSVEWDETKVVELARHLNFFMTRYDRVTPRIAIFEAPSPDSPKDMGVRYPFGPFPSIIVGRPLESYLMTIWETAVSEDPFKRFLYAYQILEYAAFYYLDDDTLGDIRKLVLAPDAPSRLHAAVREIVDAVMQMKLAEPHKLFSVVKKYGSSPKSVR